MRKALLFILLISTLSLTTHAQLTGPVFDTVLFNKNLEFASWLVEYEYVAQISAERFKKDTESPATEVFSYSLNNSWYTVEGNLSGNAFKITRHIVIDSLYNISDYSGLFDSTSLYSSGLALHQAGILFQPISDTCNLYFNSFVHRNPDMTISVIYLPAFQPSGQAIYGIEWEYIFDKNGRKLFKQNSFTKGITAVWVGQPRELWLNYRNTDKPTLGSLFFALAFRDYFTRLRIDTQFTICTLSKNNTGEYFWTQKNKIN